MATRIKSPFVIDISGWKGTINWHDVHPFPDIVVCQASEGIKEQDDLLISYWAGLKKAGIKRGAYHVFDPDKNCHNQISNYLDAVYQAGGLDEDCLPPILDVSNFHETVKQLQLEKSIKQCLDSMETLTGRTPLLHISRQNWNLLTDRNGMRPDWANQYLLWTSWYPSDPNLYHGPPLNTLPKDWENWAFWNYDDAVTVSGIKGYVSCSTISGWYAAQIGFSGGSKVTRLLSAEKFNIRARITAQEGVIIRSQWKMNSKMLAFLSSGSKLLGEAVEFVNPDEAWLQVYKPVIGWCPIVYSGRAYLSLE